MADELKPDPSVWKDAPHGAWREVFRLTPEGEVVLGMGYTYETALKECARAFANNGGAAGNSIPSHASTEDFIFSICDSAPVDERVE